jgi:outer membrane protein W
MKQLLSVVLFVSLFATFSFAQYTEGSKILGASVGLFNGGVAPGLQFHYGLNKDIDLGVGAQYWSYGDDFGSDSWNYTAISIVGMANYHFRVDDGKFDPSIGLGIGYVILSDDYDGPYDYDFTQSYLYYAGQITARYWFTPKIAVFVRLGGGALTGIVAGVDFKL